MEFPQLGKHCENVGCKQLDFLPFECSGCKKIFCLDHRTFSSHSCPCPPASSQAVATECPLCGEIVPVNPKDNVDRKMDEHISNGCQKQKPSNPCSLRGCKDHELIPVVCPKCSKNFCLAHRHPSDHECSALADAPAKPPKPAVKSNPVQLRVDSYNAVNTKKLAQQVNVMRAKMRAQGDAKVPAEKRFYLEVLFPLETQRPPVYMYFNESWSVGRVLDAVAKAGGIINMNNKMGAERLHLFALKSGDQLRTDSTLVELAKERQLISGDPILLEKMEMIEPQQA